jgi:hypothetical protein
MVRGLQAISALFKECSREVRHATTPEFIIGALLAISAYVFKWAYGGGLSLKDLSSGIPVLWVLGLVGAFYTIKSAIRIRRKQIARWKNYKPILVGNFPAPARPSVVPGLLAACFLCLGCIVLFSAPFLLAKAGTSARAQRPKKGNVVGGGSKSIRIGVGRRS